MGSYGGISGRARLSAIFSALFALILAGVLLSGPTRGQSGDSRFGVSDSIGEDAPGNISATFGSSGSGASPSETEELRRYLRGEAESRVLGLAVRGFEVAGQRYLDERFRVYSSLLWTEENRFSGSISFVVPLQERGRSVTFLQPGLIAWNGNDVKGRRDRRTDYSLGVVHRIRTGEDRFFGGSLFYDRGRYDHQRVGAGVDYQIIRTRLSGNLYYPLSDSGRGFVGAREHALRGLDATLEQGISDRFSASLTGGLWEVSGAGSEKIGDSKSTFKSDFRYHLSDVLTLRGGYEWSDDFINTEDSYRVGVDIRFPARDGNGRSTAFRSDPWAPVKRESRILVARDVGGAASGALLNWVPRTLIAVTLGGGVGAIPRPGTSDPADTEAGAEVVLSDGVEVYYSVYWNAGSASFSGNSATDDFEPVDIKDNDDDSAESSLFVDESQSCILIPAGVTKLGIGLKILRRDNQNAEIIRIRLTPAGDEASCLAGGGSGVTQALATGDTSEGGVLYISIPLGPSAGVMYGSYVSVQALDSSDLIPASVVNANAVTLTDTSEAEKVQRFRVYISETDVLTQDASLAWPGGLGSEDVVEAVVLFTSDRAIFGESYGVEVVGGDGTASVSEGIGGRYLVSFRDGELYADFAVSLGSGARIYGVGLEAEVLLALESAVSLTATAVPGIGSGGREGATITLDPTPQIAFGEDASEAAVYSPGVASETGGVLRVPVTVSYLPSEATTFVVEVNSGGIDTAIEGMDYIFTTKSVIFAADAGDKALTKYLEITLEDDSIFEVDETFTLSCSAADVPADDLGDLYDPRGNTAELMITDDELRPKMTIGSATSLGEGDAGVLMVRLTGVHSASVSGTLTFTSGSGVGGATSPADYGSTGSGAFTIPAGVLSHPISIALVDDDIDELDETFTATISTTDTNVDGVLNDTAVVTIRDNDAAPELSMLSPTLTTSEGVSAEVGVVMRGESSRDIEVGYTIILGTASVADFGAGYSSSGTITIAAGDTSGTISVATLRDSVAEVVGETFTVRLNSPNPSLATVGSANETVVTLNDKSMLLITLKDGAVVAGSEYLEGVAANKVITIEVSLSENLRPAVSGAPAVGDVVVDLQLTLPGGITIADPGDVTFSTGQGASVITRTITIPASIDNNLNEGSREIKVKAVASTSGRGDEFDSGEEPEKTLTILDDDAILTLSVDSATVVEGGTVTVMVAMTNPVGVAISVPVVAALSGSASSADFSATQGAALGSLAISIARGDTRGTVEVTNLDDRLVEGDEAFSVNFGTLSGVLSAVSGSVARTITITDNDTASLDVSHLPENPTPRAAVTFSGVLAVAGSGTGTDGIAVGNNGSVEFEVDDPAGMLAATLTFTDGNSDSVLSGLELSVDASPAWTAARVGGAVTLDFSIELKAPGTLPAPLSDAQFTNGTSSVPVIERVAVTVPRMRVPSAVRVVEGVGASITVSMSPTSGVAVSGKYTTTTTAGGAVAADFAATPVGGRAFSISAGQGSTTVLIGTTGDSIVEADETFTFAITSDDPTVADVDANADTTTVTIIDDDTATLSLTAGGVIEGDPLSLSALLSGDVVVGVGASLVFADVTNGVTISFTDGDNDGVLSGSELTSTATGSWRAGSAGTTTTFSFVASTFPVGLTAAKFTNGKSGVPATVTVTVLSVPGLSIPSTVSIAEGSSAMVRVSLSQTATEAIGGTYMLARGGADGTALASDIPLVTSGSFTIASGSDSMDISVAVPADDVVEFDETFTLTIMSTTTKAGVSSGRATITITDATDDFAKLRIALIDAGGDEITDPEYDEAVQLKAFLHEENKVDTALTADRDIAVTVVLGDAWGDTAKPAPITITKGDSDGVSPVFNVRPTATSTVEQAIPAPTFAPDIGGGDNAGDGFVSGEDGVASAAITLPAVPPIPELSISAATQSVSANEGASAQITVELSSTAQGDVDFTYTLKATDAELSDYTDPGAGSRTGIIAMGQTNLSIDVATLPDTIVEPNETLTFTIALASSETDATLKSGATVSTITITDDDTATLLVTSAPSSPVSGNEVTFAGTWSNPIELDAGEAAKFKAVTDPSIGEMSFGTLDAGNILKGDELKGELVVKLRGDGATEYKFFVSDANLTAVGLGPARIAVGKDGTPATNTVTLAKPTLTVETVLSFAEGGSSPLIALTMNGELAADSDIKVATALPLSPASAVAADITDTAQTFVLAKEARSFSLPLTITDDSIVEEDETFDVSFTQTTTPPYDLAGESGGVVKSRLTITDNDDVNAQLRMSLVSADGSDVLTTAVSGQMVKLRASVVDRTDSTPLTVATAVEVMPAEFGGNWGGTSEPQKFTIAVNTGSADSDSFMIASDAVGTVTVPRPTTFTAIGDFKSSEVNDSVVSGDIELTPLPVLSFDVAAPTHTETDSGTSDLQLTVNIVPVLDGASKVNVSVSGGDATSGTDYTVPATELVLDASAPTAVITISIAGDLIVEKDETFVVTLSPVSGEPYEIDSRNVSTVTITDNDTSALTVTATPDPVLAGNPVTVGGTLVGDLQVIAGEAVKFEDTARTLTLTFTDTGNDGVLSGGDLTAPTLTWTPRAVGATTLSFVPMGFSRGLTAAKFSTDPAIKSVTVNKPELTVANVEIAEGAVTQAIGLTMDGALVADSSITVGTAARVSSTGNVVDDIADTAGSLTLTSGMRTFSYPLTIEDDDVVEEDETFDVSFTQTTTPPYDLVGESGGVVKSRLTITDNDDEKARLRMALVDENGAVISSAAPGDTVALRAIVEDGDGNPLTLGHTLTLTLGDLPDADGWRATLNPDPNTIEILAEASEGTSARIQLASDADGSAMVPKPTAFSFPTATDATKIGEFDISDAIASDPLMISPIPVVSFVAITDSVSEAVAGGSYEFEISITPALPAGTTSTVGIALVSGGTAGAGDYGTLSLTRVALAAGAEKVTVSLPITDDGVVEGDETFIAELTVADSAPYALGTARTTVTIEDNDTAELVISADNTAPTVGEDVALTGTLTAAGGIAVGSGGTLAFTDADASGTPRLEFEDITGVGGNGGADGLLTDAELVATTTWKASVSGATTLAFVAVAPFPDALTAGQFTKGGALGSADLALTVQVPVLSLPPTATFAEAGSGGLTITIDPTSPVEVPASFALTDGTATLNSDFSETGATITIPKDTASDNTQIFIFISPADLEIEDDETFTVTLTSTDTGIATVDPSADSTTVTITDATDDFAKLRIALIDADGDEITDPEYDEPVRLKAFLYDGGTMPVTAYKEITVTPTLGTAWGDTPTPEPFTIAVGQSTGQSAVAFNVRTTATSTVEQAIPAPTFAPDIGGGDNAGDGFVSG
ncbi:MAG: inverse autotransporter beta domain-containing protein, partial [Alphaproteobacteria bacterium]